jgi:hypothetical protein
MVSPFTTGSDGGTEAPKPIESGDAQPWLDLITDTEAHFEIYQSKCDSIDKELGDLKRLADGTIDREYKMFWANLEVLKPSMYSRAPVPVVVPGFKDRKQLNVITSEMLERALITSFRKEDVHSTMLEVRDDLAVAARGQSWLRYEAAGDDADDFTEEVCIEHLDRRDFLHDPARKWAEVDWVARGSWMSAEAGRKRFKDKWNGVQLLQGKDKDATNDYKGEKKGRVWEIWCKSKNKVVWVSPGIKETLDEQDPFLKLEDFFPCPKPAYGTMQRRSTVPIPDFVQYKDQVSEINEMTARISNLADGLKLKGFYAAGSEDIGTAIERAMSSMDATILIPVANYAAMGGSSLKESIVWLPIRDVAEAITHCVALRKQLIEDVYQITGLSDIMRGATDPNETLGAQQLKSQYGSIRIREKQAALVMHALGIAKIAGEIMAENFQPQTLLEMSQMEIPSDADVHGQIQELVMQAQQLASSPQAQQMAMQNPQAVDQAKQQLKQQVTQLEQTITVEKVIALLRDQKMRPFILDIETDSTIQPDEDAEKAHRTEFLKVLGGFINQSAPLLQSMPQAGKFVSESLKFVAAPFRAGRDLNAAIDEFANQINQLASQPKGPSPEEVKAQADAKALEAKVAADMKVLEAKTQSELKLKEADMALKNADLGLKKADMVAKQQRHDHAMANAKDMHNRTLEANAQQFDHTVGATKHAADQANIDASHKLAQHGMAKEQALAKNGIPPDYSFKEDRKQFADMIQNTDKILAEVSKQSTQVASGMEKVAKALTAKKSVKGKDGHVYTVESTQ